MENTQDRHIPYASLNEKEDMYMHSGSETIVQYLKNKLSSNLEAKGLTYLGFTETNSSYLLRFMEKPNSVLKTKKVVVKLFKSNQCIDLPCNPSDNSYNFLSYLSEITSNNSCIVIPKPLARLPELNGVAKEWVEGTNLRELMRLGGLFVSKESRRTLKTHFRKVGEAMGFLHLKTYDQNRHIAKLHMNRKLENMSKSIEHLRLNYNSRYIKQGLEYLKQINSTISWSNIGTSWVHGDFVHSNVLVTDQGQIAILDFSDSRFDFPLFDVSRFMVRTLIDFGYMQHKFSNHFLLELNTSFFQGYLSLFGKKISNDLLLLYSIFNIIQFISPEYTCDFRGFLRNNYAIILLNKYMQACKVEGY